jgi:phospholipid/cholesterol/gamma-HCH transport system substrate-binding protein
VKTSAALVKLIVFIIVTSILTAILAATIGNFTFGEKTGYRATFGDVTGLLPGNDVRIAGVNVGSVDSVELGEDGLALVAFNVSDGREIPQSTIARLRYRNITGERYIALTQGEGSAEPLAEGATLPLAQTRNALDLTVLFNGFRPLFQALDPESVNQAAFEIVQVLQGEGGTVESLVAKTASLTNTLADKDAVIGRVIDNMTAVLATVDDRSTELSDLIVQLRRLATGFAQDRAAIGGSLAGINELTNATAGLLIDVREPLRRDITELRQLATTLDDNKETIDGVLSRLPAKLDLIVGTATYASQFNFFLCGLQVKLPNPEQDPFGLVDLLSGPVENTQFVNADEERCRGRGFSG